MAAAAAHAHLRRPRWFEDENIIEIIEAVLLSLATIVTAWSAYQAALWDGEQSAHYTEASAARAEGNRLSAEANTQLTIDLSEFETWQSAETTGDHRLSGMIRTQMRDSLRTALDAWTAASGPQRTNASVPNSPLSMSQYQLPERIESESRIAEAEQFFEDGEEANRRSDRYVLVTVVFALVLFVVGIGSKFKHISVRAGLAGFGAFALVLGTAFMLLQPVAALTL
jgi:hypothetical protein